MPDEFHQHSEGWVAVRTDNASYNDTHENFVTDFGQPLPELVAGAVEQIYTRGKRHCQQSVDSVIWGGPVTGYEYGDAAIAALPQLIAKKEIRESAREAEAKAKQEAEFAAAQAEAVRARDAQLAQAQAPEQPKT